MAVGSVTVAQERHTEVCFLHTATLTVTTFSSLGDSDIWLRYNVLLDVTGPLTTSGGCHRFGRRCCHSLAEEIRE